MPKSPIWEKLAHAKEGEVLELSGYLFKSSDTPKKTSEINDEKWILTDTPLPTCCRKSRVEITLLGNFSHCQQNSPLRVQGRLELFRTGEVIKEYKLSEVRIVQEKGGGFPIFTVGALILLILGFFSVKTNISRKKRNRS